MALMAVDGFDHYDTYVDLGSRKAFHQFSSISSFSNSIAGSNGFGKAWSSMPGGISFAARNAQAWFGFATKLGTFGLGISLSDGTTSGNDDQVTVKFASNFSVAVYLGSGTGTLLTLGPNNAWTPNVWVFLEVGAKIDSSTGSVEVRVNGVTVASVSGINTKSTANVWFDNVKLSTNFGNLPIDNFYYNDATGSAPYNGFLGDFRVDSILPEADSAVQFTPLANANWQEVSEVAMDSDASYNYSSTPGDQDLFDMGALDSHDASVLAVQITGAFRKDDAGDRSIKNAVKSGGTTAYGAVDPLYDGFYAYYSDVFVQDPNTSAAWALSAVNAMKAGYKVEA